MRFFEPAPVRDGGAPSREQVRVASWGFSLAGLAVGFNIPHHESMAPIFGVATGAAIHARLKIVGFVRVLKVGYGEFRSVVVVKTATILNFYEFHIWLSLRRLTGLLIANNHTLSCFHLQELF